VGAQTTLDVVAKKAPPGRGSDVEAEPGIRNVIYSWDFTENEPFACSTTPLSRRD